MAGRHDGHEPPAARHLTIIGPGTAPGGGTGGGGSSRQRPACALPSGSPITDACRRSRPDVQGRRRGQENVPRVVLGGRILSGSPHHGKARAVIIKSLDELRQVDDRTLHFTPMGLGIDVKMRPEDSAEFQQQAIAQFELAPAVAEGTRRSFDHLRTVFAYGVLCYEIFTLVHDHALLVIEQALRDRFIDYHQGTVTFVDTGGNDHAIAADRYEQVHEFVSAHRGWRLRIDAQHTMRFNGMLAGLRDWARRVGLLRGQRNRGIEQALSDLRNFVAHPIGYHLNGPVEAARTLSDLAGASWGFAVALRPVLGTRREAELDEAFAGVDDRAAGAGAAQRVGQLGGAEVQPRVGGQVGQDQLAEPPWWQGGAPRRRGQRAWRAPPGGPSAAGPGGHGALPPCPVTGGVIEALLSG